MPGEVDTCLRPRKASPVGRRAGPSPDLFRRLIEPARGGFGSAIEGLSRSASRSRDHGPDRSQSGRHSLLGVDPAEIGKIASVTVPGALPRGEGDSSTSSTQRSASTSSGSTSTARCCPTYGSGEPSTTPSIGGRWHGSTTCSAACTRSRRTSTYLRDARLQGRPHRPVLTGCLGREGTGRPQAEGRRSVGAAARSSGPGTWPTAARRRCCPERRADSRFRQSHSHDFSARMGVRSTSRSTADLAALCIRHDRCAEWTRLVSGWLGNALFNRRANWYEKQQSPQ